MEFLCIGDLERFVICFKELKDLWRYFFLVLEVSKKEESEYLVVIVVGEIKMEFKIV